MKAVFFILFVLCSKILGFFSVKLDFKLNVLNDADPKIFGGSEISPHLAPYQALLTLTSNTIVWYCGGTLISSNYVITTAACLDRAISADVLLGAHNRNVYEDTQVQLQSTEFTIHEDYDPYPSNPLNNIGVLRLPKSVGFTFAIQPAFLPSRQGETVEYGTVATATGWGTIRNDTNDMVSALQYVQLHVIDIDSCEHLFGPLEKQICAVGGICAGDQGGPLVTNGYLYGIASSYQGCLYFPAVFTQVSYYLDWLEKNTDAVRYLVDSM